MLHSTRLLALPLVAALCMPAVAASPEEAAVQLRDALSREVATLESVTSADAAAEALPKLRAVLAELDAMDRSPEAQKDLWIHIDNTPGVKQPLIELVQRLCIQLTRLEKLHFYGHEGLRAALAPQFPPPAEEGETGGPAA